MLAGVKRYRGLSSRIDYRESMAIHASAILRSAIQINAPEIASLMKTAGKRKDNRMVARQRWWWQCRLSLFEPLTSLYQKPGHGGYPRYAQAAPAIRITIPPISKRRALHFAFEPNRMPTPGGAEIARPRET